MDPLYEKCLNLFIFTTMFPHGSEDNWGCTCACGGNLFDSRQLYNEARRGYKEAWKELIRECGSEERARRVLYAFNVGKPLAELKKEVAPYPKTGVPPF